VRFTKNLRGSRFAGFLLFAWHDGRESRQRLQYSAAVTLFYPQMRTPSQEESAMAADKQHDQSRENDEEDQDEASPEENPPPQTWKHPDDGKSLSDQDQEWPLKP
jgi:hypothetical protein